MPDANVSVDHSCKYWGNSSYIDIWYQPVRGGKLVPGGIYEKARVSDHPVGLNRYLESCVSLYLSEKCRSEDWVLWLGEIIHRYNQLGGTQPVDAVGPLFQNIVAQNANQS